MAVWLILTWDLPDCACEDVAIRSRSKKVEVHMYFIKMFGVNPDGKIVTLSIISVSGKKMNPLLKIIEKGSLLIRSSDSDTIAV
jgi:hypothetical protein